MADDCASMREGLGKYFGVCPSYHHSKGCRCPECPSYPGDGRRMYCARGAAGKSGIGGECLCDGCYVYRQFGFGGRGFCGG